MYVINFSECRRTRILHGAIIYKGELELEGIISSEKLIVNSAGQVAFC